MLTRIEVTDHEQEAAEREAQDSALGLIEEAYQQIEAAIGSLTEASGRMRNATETFTGLKGTEGKVNKAVRYLTGLQGSLYQEHRTYKLGDTHAPELVGSGSLKGYEFAKGHLRKAFKASQSGQAQQALGHVKKADEELRPIVAKISAGKSIRAQLHRAAGTLKAGNTQDASVHIDRALGLLKGSRVSLR
jgi:hypothetical protein